MLKKGMFLTVMALVFTLGAAGLGFSAEKEYVTKQCGKCCDLVEVEKGKTATAPAAQQPLMDPRTFGGG